MHTTPLIMNDMTCPVPVSIIIPVKNEEANLPRALKSVKWASEVFIVDSHSTDHTPDIAHEYGATLIQFNFNGTWPKKKNWALENLPFSNEWVFMLDADEVLPPEAEGEIRRIVADANSDIAGYWINRRFMFMGRWLKHAYFPNWNLRLFKHERGRYEKLTDRPTASGDNEVHEHVIVDGRTSRMSSCMDHYAFPSVDIFIEKHNRYSNWEAVVQNTARNHEAIQSREALARRRLKTLARHLPFRPFLRFCYVYVFQRGFLDGKRGFYFSYLHGMYEAMTIMKCYENRDGKKG